MATEILLPQSALATRAADRTSGKYAFISTEKVIGDLEKEGWNVVGAQQHRVRRPDFQGYQKHVITFEPADKPITVGDTKLRLLLWNSHLGLNSFRFQLGLFRFVCTNGLAVGTDMFSVSIKHVEYQAKQLNVVTAHILDSVPKIEERVSSYQKAVLTEIQQQNYARHALVARFGEKSPVHLSPLNVSETLRAKRTEDEVPTLWNIYNRCQENLIERPVGLEGVKTRKISSPSNRAALNVKLWDLNEVFAKLPGVLSKN